MFVDIVKLSINSGKGGAGCVSFRREKFVTKGGPDGGDGGDGGNIYIKVDRNTDTLSHYKGKVVLSADNGANGESKKRYGKRGASLTIIVPPGTQIIEQGSEKILVDMVDYPDESVLLLNGGKGGLGNVHFKNSRNQAPTYAQPGLIGESLDIRLELKLIANVGLVGFPNVGKSTLISLLSNATPEIANYEFTTLTPKLGVVTVGEYDSFVMADIPGIIEGASDGRGLGIDFLRHIERTQTLLFMIDVSNYRDPYEQYEKLRIELERYSSELKDRVYAIVFSKSDILQDDDLLDMMNDFFTKIDIRPNNKIFDSRYPSYIQKSEFDVVEYDINKPYFIASISSMDRRNIDMIKFSLFELFKKQK